MIELKRDLEDEAFIDDDVEPVDFWAEKQKELLTNVVDYNLSTLSDLITDRSIDLDPKYQRRLRWDGAKQSKLIESFLMNVPVPPVFLNEDEYGVYSVIDGKQRLNAIQRFFTNNLELEKLQVFSDINGSRINDLPARLRTILRTRPTIRAVIILRQSDSDVKYEVFQRLNTGGAKLNPQEIRNNAFHGPLNDLIMRISSDKRFHNALGIKNKNRSAIYQEMRDAELVLRYFTFRGTWDTFKGGIKRAMDSFMETNRNASAEALRDMEDAFFRTLSVVTDVFGDHPFQRWVPERVDWRRQALAALFDAQMFGLQEFGAGQLVPHAEEIMSCFKALFENNDFRKSIDAATNTPTLFKARIQTLRALVTEVSATG